MTGLTLYHDHLTHIQIIYILKPHSPKIPPIPCSNKMIQGVQIIVSQSQFPFLRNHYDGKQIKTPLLKEHYWSLPKQDKIKCLTFGAKIRGDRKLGCIYCVYDHILRFFSLLLAEVSNMNVCVGVCVCVCVFFISVLIYETPLAIFMQGDINKYTLCMFCFSKSFKKNQIIFNMIPNLP